MQRLTSVRKRLDHVLNELDSLGSEPNEKTVNNIVVELAVIKKAYRESQHVPTCCFRYDTDCRVTCDVAGPCFRYDTDCRVTCDVAGPLYLEQFMRECKRCQVQIKAVLAKLETN